MSADDIPVYYDERDYALCRANTYSSSDEVEGRSMRSFDVDHISFEHERLLVN